MEQEQAIAQLTQYQAEYSAELDALSLQHEQAISKLQTEHRDILSGINAKVDQAAALCSKQQLHHEQVLQDKQRGLQQELTELRAQHEKEMAEQQALLASKVGYRFCSGLFNT